MFGQTHLQPRLRSKKPAMPPPAPASSAQDGSATDEPNASSDTAAGHSPHNPVIGTYSVSTGPRTDRATSFNTWNSSQTGTRPERTGSITTLSSDLDTAHQFSRASSIYTLGRSSFAAKLTQLTSIDLPDAEEFAANTSSIPTALQACQTIRNAARLIKTWIATAAKVLGDLDAEDDIEWASQGKESVGEVDAAINKFAQLVSVYVSAVDNLQKRQDRDEVANEVKDNVTTLEDILELWGQVKDSMAAAKKQVDLAAEWEQIWSQDLGSISNELTDLARMVFKMEEDRHNNTPTDDNDEGAEHIPLHTITEDMAETPTSISRDVSPAPPRVAYDIQSPKIKDAGEDTGLVSLFARMQPLKTELDFSQMKLASFRERALEIFPSAITELYERHAALEMKYDKLQLDAETLRAELNEDRWVSIFRNAGRQASKMCQSLERGIAKLQEGLDICASTAPDANLTKRISDYKAKKSSFAPAIAKILAVIDKGIEERKTVNGEVLKIQQDVRRIWSLLEIELATMDAALEASGQGQLRDSVSTIATQGTTHEPGYTTPGTSPASSVIVRKRSETPSQSSRSMSSSLPVRPRYLTPRSVTTANTPASNRGGTRRVSTPNSAPQENRPRWTGSTVVDYNKFGPHRRPESKIYRGPSASPQSPLARESMVSPSPSLTARPRQYNPGRRPSSLAPVPKEAELRSASRTSRRTSMLPLPNAGDKPRWRP